mgnify:CR=1 FL=1
MLSSPLMLITGPCALSTPRWVKTWETEEPSQRFVAVHSSPLPGLHLPGANVSAKVV